MPRIDIVPSGATSRTAMEVVERGSERMAKRKSTDGRGAEGVNETYITRRVRACVEDAVCSPTEVRYNPHRIPALSRLPSARSSSTCPIGSLRMSTTFPHVWSRRHPTRSPRPVRR